MAFFWTAYAPQDVQKTRGLTPLTCPSTLPTFPPRAQGPRPLDSQQRVWHAVLLGGVVKNVETSALAPAFAIPIALAPQRAVPGAALVAGTDPGVALQETLDCTGLCDVFLDSGAACLCGIQRLRVQVTRPVQIVCAPHAHQNDPPKSRPNHAFPSVHRVSSLCGSTLDKGAWCARSSWISCILFLQESSLVSHLALAPHPRQALASGGGVLGGGGPPQKNRRIPRGIPPKHRCGCVVHMGGAHGAPHSCRLTWARRPQAPHRPR